MKLASTLLLSCLLASPLAAATDVELFAAGKAALEQGDPEKAAGLLEKAVAAKPNNAEYHYVLGSAYGQWAQSAGMFKQVSLAKKVKAEFERAVQLDPRFYNARMGLISFYMVAPGFMGGGEDKALAQAAEMKKIDAFMGHRAYGAIYRIQKKMDLARKEAVEAVRERPTDPKAHAFLGSQYLAEKNYAASQPEYETALKLDAAFMPANMRIGQLLALQSKDYARAETLLKKYIAYKPADDEPPVAAAWYWLGQVYEKTNRKADAKQAYATAVKLLPQYKDAVEALKRVS
ncbi:MAG TPA: tetratricopeptide repeat protein [Thermoanaerobaculia bacterium]|nr:tetratricopeptide repeat protein [Thermoanaerobaculia bacterium]